MNREKEVAVSQDRATALQPEHQSKTGERGEGTRKEVTLDIFRSPQVGTLNKTLNKNLHPTIEGGGRVEGRGPGGRGHHAKTQKKVSRWEEDGKV